jgi:dihydroxy-acid dehydratase
VKKNLKPSQIVTRKSIENAIAVIMATAARPTACCTGSRSRTPRASSGRSTTSSACAGSPVLCDLKPSGKYVAVDLHKAGGVPQVMKMLLVHGLIHGECMTITGKTVAENLEGRARRAARDQDVIRPWSNPMYAQGHLAILKGNLAPDGCVAKITGSRTRASPGPRACSTPSPRRWTRSSPTRSSRATSS